MKALYLDCVSGIAGDMTLAALIDLGADQRYIEEQLRKLPLDPFALRVDPVNKRGIAAKKLKVLLGEAAAGAEALAAHSHKPQGGHEHLHERGGHAHDREHEAHSHEHGGHAHEHHHEHEAHSHEHGGHEHEHGPHSHEHGVHAHEHHHEHEAHSHEHGGHAHEHHHEHEAHSHSHGAHSHEHGAHDHDHHHAHGHDEHGDGHSHVHRKAADILRMIAGSALPDQVKRRSAAVFQVIAEAEGKIHGISPAEVHFHEVGAMDSIIDTIGVCLALEHLQIDEIYASPVPTGSGKMRMAHGLYPIPAPATAELLIGIPLAPLDVKGELTTPTGAGLLKALAKQFGPMPAWTMENIGYGAGEKEFDHPNVLRAVLLDKADADESDSVYVVETQVDDMTGEALGYTMDRLFAAGAVDVYYTPIHMKKNRPGILLTALVQPHSLQRVEDVLLVETTTLGVRRSKWDRRILGRAIETVNTPYGPIRIKLALRDREVVRFAPEYEDVARTASERGIAFQELYRIALKAGAEAVSASRAAAGASGRPV